MRIDVVEKDESKSAEKRRTAREHERITRRPPKDRDQPGDTETLRQDRQYIFCANKTAIKKRESWKRHEKHQRGAGHHPCIVSRARPRNIRCNSRAHCVGAAR